MSIKFSKDHEWINAADAKAIEAAVARAAQAVAADWESERPVPPTVIWSRTLDDARVMAGRALSYGDDVLPGARSYGEVPFGGLEPKSDAETPWDASAPVAIPDTGFNIAGYIDHPLWDAFTAFIDKSYGAKPRIEYSRCGGAPGWNVKYKARGRALCTVYPRDGFFICMVSVGSREKDEAEALLAALPAFWLNVKTSLYISSATALANMLLCALSGCAFALYDFAGKRLLLNKLGQEIDPHDVVPGGGRHLHAVGEGVPFAVGVAAVLGAVRVRGVARHADPLHRAGVGAVRVHVDLLEEHGAIGDVLVDHPRRRHLGDLPLELDDLHAENPLVVGMGGGKGHDALHALLEARAIDEVHAEVGVGRHRALGEVGVGVDETGHDELVSVVADVGRRTDERREVPVVSAGENPPVRNRHAAHEGLAAVASEDRSALENQIRRAHGFLRCWS